MREPNQWPEEGFGSSDQEGDYGNMKTPMEIGKSGLIKNRGFSKLNGI